MNSVRCFVAMEIPPSVIAALGEIQEGLKGHRFPVRWVRPGGIHLTLKFLGDIRKEDVGSVANGVGAAVARSRPMALGVRGVGVFPGIKRPRVIWAGLCGDTAGLIRLQAAVETHLDAVGFARQERPFKAHLTVGRVTGRVVPADLADALEAFFNFRSDLFTADAVTVFKSDLKPTGAVYTRLASIAFGQAARVTALSATSDR